MPASATAAITNSNCVLILEKVPFLDADGKESTLRLYHLFNRTQLYPASPIHALNENPPLVQL